MRPLIRLSLRSVFFSILGSALVLGAAAAGARPPPHKGYVLETIESPAGLNTAADAINDWGEVTGSYQRTDGEWRPYVWSRDEGFRLLGVPLFFGNIPYGDIRREVRDINNCGVIVGFLADGKAVRWLAPDRAERIGFQTPNGEFINATPNAINDRGEIVGETVSPVDGRQVAFFWSPVTGMREIGTLPGHINSVANGINNKGEVVGESTDFTIRRGFIWTASGGIRDIGIEATYVQPKNISDRSEVLGDYLPAGAPSTVAFRWTQKKGLVLLDPAEPFKAGGLDINLFGLVSGTYLISTDIHHAAVWDRRGRRTNLHSSSAQTSVGLSINLFGVVAGYESSALPNDSLIRAAVWWPVKYPTKQVQAAKERAATACPSTTN